MSKRALFERSENTGVLIGVLANKPIGTTLSYEELSAAISADVRNAAASNLRTAREIVERDYRQVWEVVVNVGLVRVDDGGIVHSSRRYLSRAHSAARRGLRRLLAADVDKLSNDQKTTYIERWSHLGLIKNATKPKAQEQIRAAANSSGRSLTYHESLKAVEGAGE